MVEVDGDSEEGLQLEKLGILSPMKADALGVFSSIPTLSFHLMDSKRVEELEQGDWRSGVTPSELVQFTDLLSSRIARIKEKCSKPFLDIESSYQLIADDLKVLHCNTAHLQTHLGCPSPLRV
jgi:hypothetical protein